MRLGCCAYSYRDLLTKSKMNLQEFCKTCADMGLDGVELTAYYFPDTTRSTLNEVKKYCFSLGLNISGTAVGNNFAQSDPDKRKEHVEMVKAWIDHSVILGAPCIRIFAGSMPEGDNEESTFQRVVSCLREVLPYAAERGLVLALENHGGITATPEQVLRLLNAVKTPWLGWNMDCGNFKGDPYPQFEKVVEQAVNVHAKTHYRNASNELTEVDYRRVISLLKRTNYRGYISIEYEYTDPPTEAIPRFAQSLKNMIAKA
jgi:sugar phosphate isomerase/epimerase